MADEQEILAEARQSLVRLVSVLRRIVRHMNGRRPPVQAGSPVPGPAPAPWSMVDSGPRASEIGQTAPGRGLSVDSLIERVDRELPGLRYEIARNDGLSDDQLVDRLSATQGLGWGQRVDQIVRSIPANHQLFADPGLRASAAQWVAFEDQRLRALGDRPTQSFAAVGQPNQPTQTPTRTDPTNQFAGRHREGQPGALTVEEPQSRMAAGQYGPGASTRPVPQPAPTIPPQPVTQPSPTAPSQQAPPQPPRQLTPVEATIAQIAAEEAARLNEPQPDGRSAAPTATAEPPQHSGQGPEQGPPQQAAPAESSSTASMREGSSTVRTLTAEMAGPVVVDAKLLRHAGRVVVRADPECTRATMTIRTADETGPAADAVRNATLRSTPDGHLETTVQGVGSSSGGVTISGNSFVTFGDGRSMTIDNGDVVIGGKVTVNGVQVSGAGGNINISHGASPIEVTAVVPEGSSVRGRTDVAGIRTTGKLASVDGKTASGDVVIDRADDDINARTASGNIRMGRTNQVAAHSMSGNVSIDDFGGSATLETMSGNVRVHATEGGRLSAGTMSGNIDVSASSPQVAEKLNLQTSSMTGRVSTPQPTAAPRRSSSTGARDYDAGWTGAGQTYKSREV